MSGRGGHTHRGDGALVDRRATASRDQPDRVATPSASNGLAAAWARAVRARRAAAPREPRQLTAAAATDERPAELAAPPAPPSAVPRGAGSPWLRR